MMMSLNHESCEKSILGLGMYISFDLLSCVFDWAVHCAAWAGPNLYCPSTTLKSLGLKIPVQAPPQEKMMNL